MSAPLQHLRGLERKREACQSIIEVVSQSFDEGRIGIGSSPYLGDTSSAGVQVPTTATLAQTSRYLIRLCGIHIPNGQGVILRGLRQGVTLRTVQTVTPAGEDTPAASHTFELEQTSPFWSFPDGNVSWHVRWDVGNNTSDQGFDPLQRPGQSPTLDGFDSVLNYIPPFAPYTAPRAGQPPGFGLAHLDTIRDLRYPWQNTDFTLHEPVIGPGNLVLWASVWQPEASSSSSSRTNIPGCVDASALRPEDRFLAAFPDAQYGRVYGAMMVEMMPCCGEKP